MYRTYILPTKSICVPATVWEQVLAHGHARRPEEACGLLASDRHGTATRWLPVANARTTAGRFLTDGASLLGALKTVRARGEFVCAVGHTHPSAAPLPGRRDIAGHTWPEVPMLIISLRPRPPQWSAWMVSGGGACPIGGAYFKVREHTALQHPTPTSMPLIPAGAP